MTDKNTRSTITYLMDIDKIFHMYSKIVDILHKPKGGVLWIIFAFIKKNKKINVFPFVIKFAKLFCSGGNDINIILVIASA